VTSISLNRQGETVARDLEVNTRRVKSKHVAHFLTTAPSLHCSNHISDNALRAMESYLTAYLPIHLSYLLYHPSKPPHHSSPLPSLLKPLSYHLPLTPLSPHLPTQQQATLSLFGGVCGGEIGGPHGIPSGPDGCSAKRNTIALIRAIASWGGRGNGTSGVGCEIWLAVFIHMMCLWNLDCGCGCG
jgi:hypothetical protein